MIGNSINNLPQCLTVSNKWANCSVPTDASITQVTTQKGADWSINGASLNGGTMLWITGNSKFIFKIDEINFWQVLIKSF